ncbi:hypothetical protein MLD38_007263 [Melastoma candidum]|uniref:Uncharacterized protein n=1 Tax=Melastoma candidum TaxID=119954 RepID=A0ACB9RZ28_9MYRT|nr:hypothetical protein MLD38_007263 [Melastoma candidum]
MDSQDQHQQPKTDQGTNVTAISNTDTAAAAICGKGGGPQQIGGPRPTSTRWTPTAEQIRILRDLYYNYGVRSPSAEQIQRISARLRQFGKIEGKNVFYWFQNHKARERQKKRLSSDPIFHPTNGSAQMGSYRSGSVAMEKNFKECSLSADSGGGLEVQTVGWAAMDLSFYASSSYCNVLGNRFHCGGNQSVGRYPQEDGEDEEDREKGDDDFDDAPEIETLPLFPMREDKYSEGGLFGISPSPNPTLASEPGLGPVGYYYRGTEGSWHGDVVMMAKPRESLELSLSSCTGKKSPASF